MAYRSKQELDKLLVNKKNQTATSSTQQQEISNRWPSLKLLEIIQTMVSEEPAVCVATIIKVCFFVIYFLIIPLMFSVLMS